MPEKKPTIVVAGDVTIDWFMYPVKALDEGENWRLHHALHSDALIGGAALLSKFIKKSLDKENIPNVVNGPDLSKSLEEGGIKTDVYGPDLSKEEKEQLRDISPDNVIHSNVVLDNFKVKGDKEADVLRIKDFIGYIGPPEGKLPSWVPESNNIEADIIVLDDAGNGFREMPGAWPQALDSIGDSIVIYKMSLPLLAGSLWNKVIENPPENLIVIINANDLRRIEGIHISRSLSWERTAKDFVFELQRSDALNSLKKCPYLVVLFDTDGAIIYRRTNDNIDAIIVFDPSLLEGDFAANVEGNMMGLMSISTATLVKQLIKEGVSGLTTGIKQGLANSRALIEIGYKNDGRIKYPTLNEILSKSAKYNYVYSSIELPTTSKDADPYFWRILDQKTHNTRQCVAREIVLNGTAKGLKSVPICKFGDLKTIDRAEIESYSAIKELIIEFLLKKEPKNPLCFAVFGPPGSGKSFGVKQVLKSIDPDKDQFESMLFNISQFSIGHRLRY